MSITIISDISKIDTNKWYDFLLNHPNGNVFQSPYMYEIYDKTLNFQPYIFVAFKDNEIVGLLLSYIQKQIRGPLSYLSSRSVIWGGPIVKDNNPEIINQLLIAYDKINIKKVVYTQIRNLFSTDYCKDVFDSHVYLFEDHLNILVDLSKSEDDLWKGINSNGRNKIRIAKTKNCLFEVKQDTESLVKCYKILKDIYNKAKLPLNDIEYFINLLKNSDNQVQLKIFTINYGGEIIACRLALLYANLIYDLFAGSDKNYSHLHPNDLITWEIFKWGKNNGYTDFDFGGAGKPYIAYGVREYKKKFGGEMVNYGRYEKIYSKYKYTIARRGFRLWQLMKH